MQNTPYDIRVCASSTDGQSVDAQVRQLRTAGAKQVFKETASGVKTGRAQLRQIVAQLATGDVLKVTRLDRLARSTRELLNTLDTVAKAGAGFRSLGDPWADTTTAHGRPTLTILGGLAEFERELIRARTAEASEARTRARCPHGAQAEIDRAQKREAIRRRNAGEAMRDHRAQL